MDDLESEPFGTLAAGLAGALTACLVAGVLASATRLIQHMPHNALGAIVLSGDAGILQFGEAAFLWRVSGVPI